MKKSYTFAERVRSQRNLMAICRTMDFTQTRFAASIMGRYYGIRETELLDAIEDGHLDAVCGSSVPYHMDTLLIMWLSGGSSRPMTTREFLNWLDRLSLAWRLEKAVAQSADTPGGYTESSDLAWKLIVMKRAERGEPIFSGGVIS